RDRMNAEAVKDIMQGMAERNKIDRNLVATLFDLYPQADEIILSAAELQAAWHREKRRSAAP
ncbi:MAG: hypothetical protein LBV15_00570, partial [Planctomycetota bacterium]|nr:hypothetical protein [Planctomycetota bacterium]